MNKHGVVGCMALIAALGSTSAFALLGGSVDANSVSSPWAGVGAVTVDGNVFSGALLDSTHVLTAAHVVSGATLSTVGFTLNVGGDATQILGATAVQVFPGYTGTTPGADGVWHDDLAIITLSAPVSGVVPTYSLFNGSLANQTITLVAYGNGGNGVSGATSAASASVKRAGQNRVDVQLMDDDVPGSTVKEVFVFDFDGSTAASNVFGADAAPNLTLGANIEAQFASGDSGSPVFVNDGGVWKIAGIANFIGSTTQSSGSDALFGAIGGGTIVASYIPWITSALATPVPEPHTWLLLLAGLGLVGAAKLRLRFPGCK
ncbi:MAG: trypsin-like serine protease [Thiobacillaceae bacterium]